MDRRLILLDMETQADFFLPGGSCYGEKSLAAAENVYRLFAWSKREQIPVISTVLRLRAGELGPLAKVPHCIEGSEGEQKLPRTVLPRRINLGLRNTTDLPAQLFEDYQQVIFEKRVSDIFGHARLERLLTELGAASFVLCGAGVAKSIVEAAVGLRNRGFGVILAADAVLDLADSLAEMALRRMEAKGVVFAKTLDIVAPAKDIRRGVKPFRTSQPIRK